ncbi:DUF4238 domain-containing protein [uncultured Christiangramia sp.]|uniref:DUF4238 domain-containing protein n=1 Tax=uncultured Christiangramia sp. TaxID=503836 RepID=UPI00260969EC|nr:DUF4238 domain-containing protein [uncultured Christiangramia sp.]
MQNKSWRHHYLPVFYLEGFTNENNQFKIYNVQNEAFVKEGKEFSPKSYFFEKDGNTITKDGIKDDFLEDRFYSKMDNKIALILKKINQPDSTLENRFQVDESQMPALNHFVSLMYWRLPHNKKEIDRILDESDFGLSVRNKNDLRDEDCINIEKRMKNDTEFRKGFKFYMSLIDSVKGINYRTPYTILPSPKELPALCSDNPVIFKNEKSPDVFKDDYIMPLSRDKMFFRKNTGKPFNMFQLKLMVDSLILKQAIKYVSCTDEKYISMLINYFESNYTSTQNLREKIFQVLE